MRQRTKTENILILIFGVLAIISIVGIVLAIWIPSQFILKIILSSLFLTIISGFIAKTYEEMMVEKEHKKEFEDLLKDNEDILEKFNRKDNG